MPRCEVRCLHSPEPLVVQDRYDAGRTSRPSTQYPLSLRRSLMAKTQPFHSIKQDVYHNNTSCTEGNNIEKENLRQGTGGKPLCRHRAKLA